MKCIPFSADHPDHLILFRKYVSRKAASKGRAVLEGVGLNAETIEACFRSHPLNEEEAVQSGLIKWSSGQSHKSPTWQILLAAMEYADIADQHVQGLKEELGLGMLFTLVCVCVCTCWYCCVHTYCVMCCQLCVNLCIYMWCKCFCVCM